LPTLVLEQILVTEDDKLSGAVISSSFSSPGKDSLDKDSRPGMLIVVAITGEVFTGFATYTLHIQKL